MTKNQHLKPWTKWEIRIAIEAKGTSAVKIAANVGMASQSIRQVIRGCGSGLRARQAVADALGVPVTTIWPDALTGRKAYPRRTTTPKKRGWTVPEIMAALALKSLKLTRIAREAGMTHTALRAVIRNRRSGLRARQTVADALGVPVEQIWPDALTGSKAYTRRKPQEPATTEPKEHQDAA